MKAEDWMTHDVLTCGAETSMNEAAHIMWVGDCGILPVVDEGGSVIGMITDRDVCMGAHFQGRALAHVKVADSMSRTVVACRASDPIETVIRRMGDGQVRRVPVLDERGKLVGILSINDLARALVGLGERDRTRLAPRFVEALAAICETRAPAVPEVVPGARDEEAALVGRR